MDVGLLEGGLWKRESELVKIRFPNSLIMLEGMDQK